MSDWKRREGGTVRCALGGRSGDTLCQPCPNKGSGCLSPEITFGSCLLLDSL